jgi:CO/xanthine dehydrogenase Mo-binding subunit
MTTTEAAPPIPGTGVDRVDGRLKVTGAAHYPSDFRLPDMAHAALVRSTIAAGTIARLDAARAAAMPGVLAVITHQNADRLRKARRVRRSAATAPHTSPAARPTSARAPTPS